MTSPTIHKAGSDLLSLAASKAGISSTALVTIRNWLAESLVAQEFAKLGQGGHTKTQIPLRTVFVDLPVTCDVQAQHSEDRTQLLARLHAGSLLDFASEIKQSQASNAMSEAMGGDAPGKFSAILLVGGPGQGKSTTGQLASQLFRAALLQPFQEQLSAREAEVVRSFSKQTTARSKTEFTRPKRILFPLSFELPKVAEWLSEDRAKPADARIPVLIQYLADLQSGKNAKVNPADLWQLVQRAPVFIVLDGFDEVGANRDREMVVAAARQLFLNLGHYQNTGQVLATTRPQGYADELSNMGIRLRKWFLAPLEQDEALAYAKKLVEVKIEGADLQKQTMRRLEEAAQEPATQRLMSTPLQVTILAALVEQLGSVPRERWNLFSRYFGYTYDREIERKSYASNLLRDHRNHIERIHARVGLLLQVEAEAVGGGAARMGRQRLEEVISEVLREDELAEDTHDRLVVAIANAAQLRLVFLVEPEPNRFGFDIRSLQEFMAAWALTDGRDDDVVQRMTQVARASMFRNVFVFIASKLYSISSPLRENIGKLCDELNSSPADEISSHIKSGSLLAIDILEEGAVGAQPRQSRAILERATQLLNIPISADHIKLAMVVDRENEQVLQSSLRRILEQQSPSIRQLEACWTCLAAADGLGREWAMQMLAGNIEKLYSATGFRFRSGLSIALSVPLQKLLEQHSRNINIFDLASQTCVRRTTEKQTTWLASITATFSDHRRYRRLMVLYLGDRIASNAPLPPTTTPPAGWEALAACVRFEASPSSETLALALVELAKSNDPSKWAWLSWNLSWPISSCVNAARNSKDLSHYASLAVEGKLGDLKDWLAAEIGWPSLVDPELVLNVRDSDLPWSLSTLAEMVPLMAIPPWTFRFDKKRNRVNLGTIKFAHQMLKEATHSKLKERFADICLNLVHDVSAQSLTKTVDISEWIRLAPRAAGMLGARPTAISEAEWKILIEQVDLSKVEYWGASLQTLFSSVQSIPWNRFAINVLSLSLESVPRHGALRMIGAETLAATRSVWAASFKEAYLTDARSIIVAYIFKLVSPDSDERCVDIVSGEAVRQEQLWREFIGALHMSEMAPARLDKVLSLCAKSVENSNDLAFALRERLQSRRSGLELPGVWTRLNLPLPRPAQSNKEVATFEIKSTKPIHISSLVLKDIGGIDTLAIRPKIGDPQLGQWVVILGPNGSGKTTTLKSIALALRNLRNPTIWPRGTFGSIWRRVMRGNTPVVEGQVDIEFEANIYCTRIFSDDASKSMQSPPRSGTAPFQIFAYGCRRGSVLGGGTREVNLNSDDGPEIATLFDENESLIHAETWLVGLEGDSQKSTRSARIYGAVVEAMKDLLDLESIEVADRRVWVKEQNGPKLHLSALSDGYLTTAGWFLDLVARWIEHPDRDEPDLPPNFLQQMVGLVLIDELDLHLHPKWQIEVIARTKKILPRMSFWVTTHNPLCLVGAKADEIWMLEKVGDCTNVQPGKEAPLLLTGSQIYKRYFGIGDIYPDEVGRALQRYGFLFSYDAKNDEEQKEFNELHAQLLSKGVLSADADEAVS